LEPDGKWLLESTVAILLVDEILRLLKPERFHNPLIIMFLAFVSLCIAMVVFEYFLRAPAEYRVTAVACGNKGISAHRSNP
jgi:hypothetical protein